LSSIKRGGGFGVRSRRWGEGVKAKKKPSKRKRRTLGKKEEESEESQVLQCQAVEVKIQREAWDGRRELQLLGDYIELLYEKVANRGSRSNAPRRHTDGKGANECG